VDTLLTWLTSLSQSSIRAFRHTCAFAGIGLCIVYLFKIAAAFSGAAALQVLLLL